MNTALCAVPVCPVRGFALQEHEIVSQLLFGEAVEILELAGDWVRIRCLYDGYEGWCMANQLERVPEEWVLKQPASLVQDWAAQVYVNSQPMHIPFGSLLQGMSNGKTVWGSFTIESTATLVSEGELPFNDTTIRQTASVFLNTAYLWGGRSVFGVDCSGLVQTVFRFFGKQLPRDASQQALVGEGIGFLQEARCGDLAFFDNAEGKIVHVGLLLSSSEIMHAAGKVRIDRIDNEGIIHSNTDRRTHKLRLLKRV